MLHIEEERKKRRGRSESMECLTWINLVHFQHKEYQKKEESSFLLVFFLPFSFYFNLSHMWLLSTRFSTHTWPRGFPFDPQSRVGRLVENHLTTPTLLRLSSLYCSSRRPSSRSPPSSSSYITVPASSWFGVIIKPWLDRARVPSFFQKLKSARYRVFQTRQLCDIGVLPTAIWTT